MRPGAQTIALLASPLNCTLLRSLADGPQRQTELRRVAGFPAHTTLRAHLKALSDAGAIARYRRNRFPGALEFQLTDAGSELSTVTDSLQSWLGKAPGGPLELGSDTAKTAIRALAEGWSTSILRALAAGPLSLTELDHIIGSLSYPSLERRMAAMRLSDQIEAKGSDGRGTPYTVTRWLRQGVAPLTVATRWERRHLADKAPPLTRIDSEAAFLLAVPLLRLPADMSGSCRMSMEISNGARSTLAGVLVDVKQGRVASCATRLRGTPDAWASGSAEAWLTALVEADCDSLELGGDGRLARTFLQGLHRELFGDASAASGTAYGSSPVSWSS